MVVLTDVTTPPDQFDLGRATLEFSDLDIELDRVVPLDEDLIPYLWVDGDVNENEFIRSLTKYESVAACRPLERIRSRTLFRIEWTRTDRGILPKLIESEATIVEGRGVEPWFFRLRFPDRETLTDFYDRCRSTGLVVEVDRVYTLSEAFNDDAPTVTDQQHEILTMAVHEGYFDVPRGATLGDLAEALDISKQAASERLRRGLATVVEEAV